MGNEGKNGTFRLPDDEILTVVSIAGNRHTLPPSARKGSRPRLLYTWRGVERIAVGRRGERPDLLAEEIARCYPGASVMVARWDSIFAEYVAGWITAKDAAKAMRMRKQAFLALAQSPANVERSLVMDDDLLRRMWHVENVLQEAEESDRTPDLHSGTESYRHAGHGIAKTVRTGKFTTRGKPRLQAIGRECSYRGLELRIYPHVPVRWTQQQLLGLPVAPDWGTRSDRVGNPKPCLQTHSRDAEVLELQGVAAQEHCRLFPSQPKIPNTLSTLSASLAGSLQGSVQIRPVHPCAGQSSAVLVHDGTPPAPCLRQRLPMPPGQRGRSSSLADSSCTPDTPKHGVRM